MEYNFDKNYLVEFPEREELENVLVENTETVKNWYTDGSIASYQLAFDENLRILSKLYIKLLSSY